jgi:UDPglucose 6-dehydrogenase
MRVGIVGMGTVGHAMRDMFAPVAGIVEYDVAGSEQYPRQQLAECDFAVICVSTPMAGDRSCDTVNVEQAVEALPLDRILIKSTVPPGTTDRLAAATGKHICFSPEYVGESNYPDAGWGRRTGDVPFLVIGGAPADRSWFLDRLVQVLGPAKSYFQCSAREAEIIKYMENSFLATKVAFVNEFYEICQTFEADWHTVREGWLLDPRIGTSHSAVFPDARGFGGKCLPKDVNAIISAAAEAGYKAQLLEEVLAANDRVRSPFEAIESSD